MILASNTNYQNTEVKQQSETDKHPFNGLFSRTIWVRRHQKGQNNLDFNEERYDRVAVASAG